VAVADGTTACSFTPIPAGFISESNSEIETLRSLEKLWQLLASSEATGDSTSVRERRRSQSAEIRPRIPARSLPPSPSGSQVPALKLPVPAATPREAPHWEERHELRAPRKAAPQPPVPLIIELAQHIKLIYAFLL
jgi:hypothetical protein